MTQRVILVAACVLLTAALLRGDDLSRPDDLSPGDAAVNDLSDLQGHWQVVGMEVDGRSVPEIRWKHLHWSFEGDRLTTFSKAMVCRRGQLISDRTTNPHRLLVAYAIGRPVSYAFRLRGDRLEVAQSASGDAPAGFTPDLGCDTLFVLDRIRK